MSFKEPRVAPGINYQNKWENTTQEDKENGNITEETRLFYDEFDPLNRKHNRNFR